MTLDEFRDALLTLCQQADDIPKSDILSELEMMRDLIRDDLPDDDC